MDMDGPGGMDAAEKVILLQACIKGERRKTVDYTLAEHRRRGIPPADSYQQIVARLMAFQEPLMERQRRLNQE